MRIQNLKESSNYTVDGYDPTVQGPYNPSVLHNLTYHEHDMLANGMSLGDILFIRLIKAGKVPDPDGIPLPYKRQ